MSLWQFWIDVGGTFTDCLARGPDGSVRAYKVLSSGVVKGRVEEVLSDGRLRCSGLDDYETGFFDDYEIRRLGPSGSVEQTGRVVGFEAVGSAEDGRLLEVTPSASQWRDLSALGSFELDGGEPAPLLAIRCSLGLRLREPIGEVDVRLGTTLGTNALLERTGATTALVTTEGFADVLRIGNQNRPRLFELDIRKSEPLHEVVVEIGGRLSADGEVVEPIDRDRLTLQIAKLVEDGVDAIAVCLLNSYRNDSHERVVAEVAAGLGCAQVSLSSEISPTQKIVARGHTTLVDAYLTPVIRRFVAALRDGMPEARLRLMTSAGGLVEADDCSGFDTVLSGPAGGVVALSEVAERAGIDLAIGFDMGGTSTDVSRFSGEFTYEYEAEKAGVKIVAPMLAIETVAAGGGSICDFDGQKLRVGPLSAGADPGPACYGRGGPLAVTDMNLYLGRLEGSQFPFTLARSEVSEALAVLRDRIADEQGRELGLEELAEGFLQIANANMAAAIQKISLALGYDLREYILVSFGGAGGQHACAVASELGMRSVLVHPFSGVLSAYGMGVADVKKFAVRTVLERYDAATLAKLEPLFVEVEANLRRQILVEGVSADRIQPPRRQVELRYHGQSSTLTVEGRSDPDPLDAFEEQHRKLYGHVFEGREVEIVAARVEMIGVMDKVEVTRRPEVSGRPPPDAMARTYFGSTWTDAGIYRRSRLSPGDELQGPAIVVEPTATTVVEPGWRCLMLSTGDLLLESAEVGSLSETDSSEADP
ncbi:MAG: hydantoinase/oxoprolinase family protein, partial [Acidobacteria bacterium]|nr:hydantoinase/oxoprolinase family protein [Acidobacteriota bacterium]